jgi:hypothetical protein
VRSHALIRSLSHTHKLYPRTHTLTLALAHSIDISLSSLHPSLRPSLSLSPSRSLALSLTLPHPPLTPSFPFPPSHSLPTSLPVPPPAFPPSPSFSFTQPLSARAISLTLPPSLSCSLLSLLLARSQPLLPSRRLPSLRLPPPLALASTPCFSPLSPPSLLPFFPLPVPLRRSLPFTRPPPIHHLSLSLSITHARSHALTHSIDIFLSLSFPPSFLPSLSLAHSLARSLARSLTCTLPPSLACSLTRSLRHSLSKGSPTADLLTTPPHSPAPFLPSPPLSPSLPTSPSPSFSLQSGRRRRVLPTAPDAAGDGAPARRVSPRALERARVLLVSL